MTAINYKRVTDKLIEKGVDTINDFLQKKGIKNNIACTKSEKGKGNTCNLWKPTKNVYGTRTPHLLFKNASNKETFFYLSGISSAIKILEK